MKIALIFLLLTSVPSINLPAQVFHLGIPINLDVGVGYARMDNSTPFRVSQSPAVFLNLMSGMSLRYKERLGLVLEGGLHLDTYNYSAPGSVYSLSLFNTRARGSVYYLSKAINRHGSVVHVGFAAGFTFYTEDTEVHEAPAYTATSRVENNTALFISPELGLSQLNKEGKFDLLLSYTRHLDDTPGFTTEFIADNGRSLARASGNYLALRLRYHIPLKPRPRTAPAQKPAPVVSEELASRNTRVNREINMRPGRIKLIIRDNADEDGDSISVSLNGRVVLDRYEILKTKKRLRLRLDHGANSLVIYAHNEGLIPPNTASVTIRQGLRKIPLVISTAMNRNEEIRLMVD